MPTLTISCWSCMATFATLNDMSTHHLDAHERPLPVHAGEVVWTPARRATRWVPAVRGGG